MVSATHAEARYAADLVDGTPSMRLLITGIGKTAAAAGTAAALAGDPAITEVVNIGSAGALRDGLTGVHEARRVLNHDISADAIRALGHDPQEWLTLGSGEVTLATGDVFVSDPLVRGRLAEVADLVDMEGYAVAWAARAAGVPARLVKHVSDNADETALDWAAVVDASARALADWLAARL